MESIKRNGWNLYFHPLFERDYIQLRSKVLRLHEKLPEVEYKTHTDVKLYADLYKIINFTIPEKPLADYFVLRDELKIYSRVKKKGLPDRYRLFFKVFEEKSSIVILWLGYPRKEGAKNDCYEVFKKKVNRGEFPADFKDLMAVVEEFNTVMTDFAPPSLDERPLLAQR